MSTWKTILLTGILAVCMGTASIAPAYAWDWNKTETAKSTEEDMELAFTFQKTTIHMNDEVDTVFKTLKKADTCFEQESCVYQGVDRTYTYEGFELGTYTVTGQAEKVKRVVLLDDSVATLEGLTIGSGFEDMTAAYGAAYEKEGNTYCYTAGNTCLKIETEHGKVCSIIYELVEE
ncbi:MAG: hypothetical protein Q4D90_07210 [bacterium]|nr:hypothetical protein [bacterium]